MNVIIVSKFLSAPKKLALRDPRVAAMLGAFVAVLLGAGAGIGYLLRGDNANALAEIAMMRDQVSRQQDELERAKQKTRRDVDALAVRMAELQATAVRLNALGERLTRVGQLDQGEFDFGEPPALGGPEEEAGATPITERSLLQSMDDLSAQFSWQAEQMQLLESLLLDRDVDRSLMPSLRPITSGYASSSFGYRTDPFTGKREFHKGLDFHSGRGAPVLAVADGVASFVGKRSGYGNVVEIDHGGGYMTRYAHNQENMVKPGQRIRAGEQIAKMGSTGRSTGPHVHFEVWVNGRVVNPYQYLKSARG